MDLTKAQIGYLAALFLTLVAVWFFGIRAKGASVQDWYAAAAGIGGFIGLIALVLKLVGY